MGGSFNSYVKLPEGKICALMGRIHKKYSCFMQLHPQFVNFDPVPKFQQRLHQRPQKHSGFALSCHLLGPENSELPVHPWRGYSIFEVRPTAAPQPGHHCIEHGIEASPWGHPDSNQPNALHLPEDPDPKKDWSDSLRCGVPPASGAWHARVQRQHAAVIPWPHLPEVH